MSRLYLKHIHIITFLVSKTCWMNANKQGRPRSDHILLHLIWVYTVYCGLSDRILRVYMVYNDLGSVAQSIVSLISSLVVKMLIVLVSVTSNSQVFLLKKCE